MVIAFTRIQSGIRSRSIHSSIDDVAGDPQGQQTQYGYNKRGQVATLTDPKTNVAGWTYDVQGWLVGKQYPDTSTVTYAYEATISRLKSVTEALTPKR